MASGSTHDRYKEATDWLADWLVKTANNFLDIANFVRDLATEAGRQRAAAGGQVNLHTDEYLLLAQQILGAVQDAVEGIAVPGRALQMVEKAIRLRREDHDKYAARSMSVDGHLSDYDRGHLHFITELQRVETTLREAFDFPKAAEQRALEEALSKEALSTAKSSNVESKLNKPSKPTPQAIDENKLTVEVQRNPETRSKKAPQKSHRVDLSKAKIICAREANDLIRDARHHLSNLHATKTSALDTLEQCRRGEVGVIFALKVTNAAFELMKCADDAFSGLHPELDTYSKLLELFDLQLEKDSTKPVVYVVKKMSSSASRSQIPDNVLELLCPMGATVIEVFQETLSRYRTNRKTYEGGSLEMKQPSARENEWRQHHGFCKILQDNVGAIEHHASDDSIDDRDRYVVDLVHEPNRTWLSPASELYLTVIDVLGESVSSVPKMLQTRLDNVYTQLYYGHNVVVEVEGGQAAIDSAAALDMAKTELAKAIQMLQTETEVLNRGDFSSSLYEEQQRKIGHLRNNFVHDVSRFLPVHAGAQADENERLAMETACENTHRTGSLQCMSFIYEVGIRAGFLENRWVDIELLKTTYGKDGHWMPEYSPQCSLTTIAAGLKHALGIESRIYSAASRHGAVISGHLVEKGRPFTGPEMARKLADSDKHNRAAIVDTASGKRLEIVLHSLLVKKQKLDASTKASRRSSFTPAEMLAEFKERLAREQTLLAMNLSGLLQQYGTVLEQMKEFTDPATNQNLVGFALELTSAVARFAGDSVQWADSKYAPFSTIVNEYIAQRGGHFSKMADKSIALEHLQPPGQSDDSDDVQAQREADYEKFSLAGTSTARIGNLVSFYHPRLTTNELKLARNRKAPAGCVHLPVYMMTPEDGTQEDQEDDEDTEDRRDSMGLIASPKKKRKSNEKTDPIPIEGPVRRRGLGDSRSAYKDKATETKEAVGAGEGEDGEDVAAEEDATAEVTKKKKRKHSKKKKAAAKDVVAWKYL
ncbi:hypothetical protein PRZ48_014049 [Zasmidium cellare]|uniref:DUF6604 domain-containing protein n=1 Tax=Zasmidium cellare TaxID=395010 RepID=A0ABR0E0D5_ZASCE|nr:hypothetical protein PRZ48_014049 [Zasmidium cellare]